MRRARNGVSTSIKSTRELAHSLSYVHAPRKGQVSTQGEGGHLQGKKRTLLEPDHAGILISVSQPPEL